MRHTSLRSVLKLTLWSLFLAAFAFALPGCSIFGGDSDGGTFAGTVDTRTVTGRVLAPDDAPQNITADSIRAAFAGRAGIKVALEELPNISDDTDENGVYVLENVPVGGPYHVVAWLEPGGQPYRVRSVTITADGDSSVAITVADLQLAKANRVVNGKLVNSTGAALPANTKMWLWGKEFFLGDKGLFTSPALPETATQAQIIVDETATTRRYTFTAPFVATAAAT
ncbi:MAG TPA: carboxypeptidase-like regulatory domain-containing protein, partial [Candidatus Ozemobacteraceae bacterium]|nr:carboxypeptidase-like regulatory domain-containing protein [Candidatus Ozemobacteraceae bacterium]